ncbi:MAG: DHHW family protein [Peptostreptococcaceae bacterium]
MNKLLKHLTIWLFLGFIFIVPIITLTTPDKKINEIENKILTQLPKLSLNNIVNKRFMNEFDKYTADQFPLRSDFIKLKNSYSYSTGQREFRSIYIGKNNRLMEKFVYNKYIVDTNINTLVDLATTLKSKYNISTKLMIVPTSIAFYEEELPLWAISDNEKTAIDYISSAITDSNALNFYSPYNVLMDNKDKYIFFNTDHHWTQLGAKLAYEDMYNTKILDNSIKVSDDFYGSYYSKAILPNINGDNIYAYTNFNNFKIDIDFSKTYDSLYDENKLVGKNKYQYFLHGDPAFAVIEGNPSIDDEILIFKDSYAHSFIPFLTSNYKKIHIVDPRYYNIDYEDYLSNNRDINEILFINNIQTFNSTQIFKN